MFLTGSAGLLEVFNALMRLSICKNCKLKHGNSVSLTESNSWVNGLMYPTLLVAADIHCQPNTGPEPFGIAFVEALYAGLPVVTTAIGGGLEIVDESCGKLVAPDDANALSKVLRSLITNPGERAILAAGGLSTG
jgi:glycosyltransferase involved in cell wall biosynthesis